MSLSKSNQNYFLRSTLRAKDLEILDELNKNSSNAQGISKKKMFLISLSTTVMLAKKKTLPKEYYQWTRAYLETIRNHDGTSLPNITGLLKHIDWFENHHQIADELQNSRVEIPSNEKIEIKITEPAEEDIINISKEPPLLNSTAILESDRDQMQVDEDPDIVKKSPPKLQSDIDL